MILKSPDSIILEKLTANSKTSLISIGKAAGLSRFGVRSRIEKLFRDNVILGPTVVVNPSLVGLDRTVFFEFKTNPHEPWLAKQLEDTECCDMLDGIAGEYSLFGRFRAVDDEHFRRLLKRVDEAMARSFFKKYRVVNAIRIFKEAGVPLEPKEKKTRLDEVDLKILDILLNQTDYVEGPLPLSTVKLSRLLRSFGIKISQPAVFQRLSRLKENGVVLRHTVRVNHAKLGLRTKLVVRIRVNPSMYDTVASNFLTPMNEITDLYRTGEEYGLLSILRIHGVMEYNLFLLKLYRNKDIIDTFTTLVLEERKSSSLPLRK